MSRKHLSHLVLAGGGLVLGLPFLVSCVPYQQYDKALEELQEARTANDDLVRRYHQELMRRGQAPSEGTDGSFDYANLLARYQDLERRLSTRGDSFDPEDLKEFEPGQVALVEGGLSFKEHLLFSPGVAQLKKGHLPALDTVARLLQGKYRNEKIIVEGHTDNQPLVKIKKFVEDNLNLGYLRARAVYKYLREKHGIPEARLVVVTYGYTKPVDPTDVNSEEGRRKNRRVVIRRGGEIRSLVQR